MSNLAHAPKASLLNVPGDRVMSMLSSCAEKLQEASTIKETKKVTELAEALAAMAKRLEVSQEIQKHAVLLVMQAEKKLGKIMKAMPRRTKPGKCEIIANHGIDKRRMSTAQRLADIPDKTIERVIENGAQSMHAVNHKLGLLSDNYHVREQRAAAYKLLAEEAVALLERSVKRGETPHVGTTNEMVRRLQTLQTTGPKAF